MHFLENRLFGYLQVFVNMQPLGVCLSYQRTMDIIKLISQDHDIEVSFWADELIETIKKPPELVSQYNVYVCIFTSCD